MTIASYDTRDVGSRPDPERRLAELARAGGPLRRVLAAVSARMVACKGWDRLGYASASDYARERLGRSASSLNEWARVGRRLAGLPRLEASLVSGELPWSKVRLLARFVTPENEAGWIVHAKARGVRVLERQVRAVDRAALETGGLLLDEEGAPREPAERVGFTCSPALCFEWQRVRTYAARVAGGRLAPGAVLEMVTAETLSLLPLDAQAAHELRASDRAPNESRPEAGDEQLLSRLAEAPALDSQPPPRCELPRFLRPLVAGLEDASPFELDARLRRAVRLEQRFDSEIGPLLRQVVSAEHDWKGRRPTVAAFARDHLGMSPRKARALLRLERVADGCPELRRAYADGALSWLQAQTLAPLLICDDCHDHPWRQAWVGFAARITVRGLEELVDHAGALREADPARWARLQQDPERLAQELAGDCASAKRQVCVGPSASGEGWRLRIAVPTDVARLFRATLCSVRRALERKTGRLPSEGEAFGAMLDHALRAWGVDEPWLARKMKRVSPVFERDGWRCTVPGCSTRRNLHAHHIVFRSAGGSDQPENLTTLCATHHHRGVHAGRIAIRGRAPQGLTFEIGLRSGLPPLERYRSHDLVFG